MNGPLPTAAELPPGRAWALAVLIAVALFAAVAPTLPWTQFTNGNENIVAQTALEMRHGGPKLLPKLLGEPRVKKPPLVAWATALSMRPPTVARLNDPRTRDAAYADLAFEARWPALLAGAVMVLATFESARVWGGTNVAIAAAMVVGTNYLFIKYLRQATTDAHLAAWVTVTNACLAHGLLRGRWWPAAVGGGLALGLAFMCKGPVALVETIVPAVVAAVVLNAGRDAHGGRRRQSSVVFALATGVAVFLAVALPWFVHVLRAVPGVAATWAKEVDREGATTLEASSPTVYLQFGLAPVPWLAFGVVGLVLLWQRRRERAAWVPFVFAVAPLLVIIWFRDRKERYTLPMIGPAAVICGYGLATWARSWRARRTRLDVCTLAAHAAVVGGIAFGLLAAGSTVLKRAGGGPWFPPAVAIWGGVALLAVGGLAGLALRRGRAWVVPGATFVVMLGVTALYFFGYAASADGRAPLKPIADAIRTAAPGAAVYDWLPRGRADEQLALYLNTTILRADPATLVAVDRPLVLIMRQAKQDLPPRPPAAWQLLATAKEGAATWFAYVLTPAPVYSQKIGASAMTDGQLPARPPSP